MKKRILLRLVSLGITAAILFSFGGQLLAAETDETSEERTHGINRDYEIDYDFDNDELAEQYISCYLSSNRQAYYGTYDYESTMSGDTLAIYKYLLQHIQAIAAGTETSTDILVPADVVSYEFSYRELGISFKASDDDMQDAIDEVLSEKYVDYFAIFDTLLNACPYELYWFDKTIGMSMSYLYDAGRSGVVVNGILFSFAVENEYQDGDQYTVNSKFGQAVTAARENVSAIIAANAAKDDYSKLLAYADTICDMVEYNDAAVEDESTPYGNPWQLIWVFDGDVTTDVVCEGYSKAFQYLCDNTAFDEDSIYALTVYGEVLFSGGSAGPHMWSLVHMDDGKNYHVDVTAIDTGGGYDFFLKGATKQNGSIFWINGQENYIYDQNLVNYYESDELLLATEDYEYTGSSERYNVVLGDIIKNCTPELSASSAREGAKVTVTVNPVEGYEFDYITVNDTKVGSPEFVMPAEDVVVNVYCKKIDYKITCASAQNGKVTTNTATANVGDIITITVTPADGYELKSLTVKDADGNAIEVKDGEFEMPASDVTVSAAFKKIGIETGWVQDGDSWYYYLEDGSLAIGWLKVGAWYYFDEEGVMQTGWQKIGGVWYCFRNSGSMYSGEWLKWGNSWYYLTASGAMATGWVMVGGNWYLFNDGGVMLTGWQKDGGLWYYLAPSGAMKTGWLSSGGKWYYLKASGEMAVGWVQVGDLWYYMDPSTGAMVTGVVTINGKRYRFADDGHCLNP